MVSDQQRKCMECRECCEYVEYPVTMLSIEVLEFFAWRAKEPHFYIDKDGAMMFRVHDPCKHLTENGCSIYENRPTTCRVYMCEYGDKSVKEVKKKACEDTMKMVVALVEKHRRETAEDSGGAPS